MSITTHSNSIATPLFAGQHAQPVPAFGARKAKRNLFASYAPNTSLPVVTSAPSDTTPLAAARKRLYWSV